MTERFHEPVMVSQVLDFLLAGPGRVIVDGTIGGGGHAEAVLGWAGTGKERVRLLVGLDRDPEAIRAAGARLARFRDRLVLIKAGYERMREVMDREGIEAVDGVLLDLGASRRQLTAPERGMSLVQDGPLDMRMDPEEGESAADMLLRLDEDSIARIIRDYGEERYAKRIAREIVKRREGGRPVKTTFELKRLVGKAVPGRGRTHPATRTFQALRIATNRELERLAQALEAMPECLAGGGRAVVLSYHSLEDRMVKQAFARQEKGCTCPPELPECVCRGVASMRVLTRKPLRPSREEVEKNPSARGAKLRAAQRVVMEDRK